MATESGEETLEVPLPTELGDWLETRADELGVDRTEVVVQLLSTYRTTAALDDDGEDAGTVLLAALDDEGLVDRAVERVEDEVAEAAAAAAEDAVADEQESTAETVRADLTERIDALEADVDEMIEDVRERVIQVKREADERAPADHDHEEFERFDALAGELADVEERLDQVGSEVAESQESLGTLETETTERLDDVEERLETVAWVVSDLREAFESRGGREAVDRIKRAAAAADVDRARCENCGDGVEIALLTRPECPHCEATVTDVKPGTGWFGTAELLVASQLESGEER